MATQTWSPTETPFAIHPATRLGHVHLTVAELERQFAFYQEVLGFTLHWRAGATAGLGAGEEDLLRLTEVPGAQRVRHTTGLYHFALQFPSRRELARALAMRFYHDVLGFKVVSLVPNFRIGDVSVNGKQVHTIAFNTWMGEGAPPPPADALGMRYFTIVLPNTTELEHVVARVQQAGDATEQTEEGILVHDPSESGVVLATAPNS